MGQRPGPEGNLLRAMAIATVVMLPIWGLVLWLVLR